MRQIKKIKAGAGQAILDFPVEMFPTDGFKGIHDAPQVRLIILDAGERIAIAAVELVNIPSDGIDLCRKIISTITNTPYENIWIHATHAITTPHAPGGPLAEPWHKLPAGVKIKPLDPKDIRRRELFIDTLKNSITKAAVQARESFRNASIGIGTGTLDINTNRDIETPFGWWIGLNGHGLSNKNMSVLRINAETGESIAFLLSYGIKPCAIDNAEMDKNTRLVSSDIPGRACTLMEEEYGVPCLFCTSAAGDQIPKEQAWYSVVDKEGKVDQIDLGVTKGLEIVERLGSVMGKKAIEVAGNITCNTTETSINRYFVEASFPAKNRGDMPKSPVRKVNFIPEKELRVGAEIITMGSIALIAVKPEVNCTTELDLQKKSPYKYTLLMSMVNGGLKYMPDQASYDRGTWEAQNTLLGPGTAEKWEKMVIDTLDKSIKEEAL